MPLGTFLEMLLSIRNMEKDGLVKMKMLDPRDLKLLVVIKDLIKSQMDSQL
jgi:hypothetical protein